MSSDRYRPVPYQAERFEPDEMRARAEALRDELGQRRSVRHFSSDPIPAGVIEAIIQTASSAPSGANKQPWTFVVVTDAETKRRIRQAAEVEERAFYEERAPQRWLDDLAALGTGPEKPFLEEAPALIAVFAQKMGYKGGERHYYVSESVGIACGFLIAAIHHAGLVTLTHTPSPMKFLGDILSRPITERPYLLLPIGFPRADCEVPDITRKPLCDVLVEI